MLTFVLLYFLSDQLFAAELNLTERTDYFLDIENHYTIDTLINAPEDIAWQENRGGSLNLGFSSATIWLRMPVKMHLDQVPGLFEVSWPFIDRLQAFWVNEQGIHDLGVQGDHTPHSQRDLQHRFFVFPLSDDAELEGTLYLKINTQSSILLPMQLWSMDSFFVKESRHQIFLGFFYGLLAIILIYNFGMWFYDRDRVYLYYVAYLGFLCVYVGSLTGLGQQYFWGNSIFFNDAALLIGVLGSFVFGSFFVDSFLQLDKNNPVAHRCIVAAIGIYFLLIAGYFLYDEATITPVGQVLGVIASVFAYVVGIREWKKGNPDARYFTVAWSMLLLGTCIYTLYLAGLLPGNTIIINIQIVGLVVEMVLLSFALSERFTRERAAARQATEMALHLASEVNKSHVEKIRMQDEANHRLEAKVEERTCELKNTLNRLEEANHQLEALSHTDQLTGLKNRRYFTKHYDKEFRRSIRNQQPISVIVLDIDHFKQVNDTYGHLAGDACLKQVAEVIGLQAQRPADMAVRFGGEEFVIMLPNTDAAGASKVSEYIREQVENLHIHADGADFKVTISLGIASMVPDDSTTPETLVGRADAALYRAKSNGRNRFEVA